VFISFADINYMEKNIMTKHNNIEAYDWDRLEPILCEYNKNDIVYVYRLGTDNWPVKPYLTKCGLLAVC
jgi:hypothetical protein